MEPITLPNTSKPINATNIQAESENPSHALSSTYPSSTPSTSSASTRVAKRQTPNELRAEYLEIERKKLKMMELELTQRNDRETQPKSEDYHFLMSILPQMERLPPIQKIRLRNKINQALLQEMEIGKRSPSALSSESDGSEQSDATIKGSNEDEENSYQVVRRKAKRVTRRQKVSNQNINATQPLPMDVASLESPASPNPSVGQPAISAPKQVCNDGKSIRTVGSKPSAPSRAKILPPVCLRGKSKWNAVSAECSRQRIQ
ncbi:hypothetical protein EVAR_96363_1 [Eumeta japonica]|uniref:BESS domain-containing protein n=1 Tax=Eumeta variegata TaxID=151549 RepID=A0A4C1VWC2_EUMVA|nr:hypothetical protein EVAR_96363_1 [Eumeta japonica]